jgi:hypothetical protein
MAPVNSNPSGSPRHGAWLLPVTPTPELQELYDELRRAEDEQNLCRRLPLQDAEELKGPNALLQPGAHPQATSMSRSPSGASHTSTKHGGIDADAIGDNSRPDTRPKKRAIRRRPLDKVGKAKAALVRKLHACPECKTRKVTVSA